MVEAEEMTVLGDAGQPIDLPIGGGPATGHVWVLDLPDGVIQLGGGPATPVPAERAQGGASNSPLRVQAAEEGLYVVEARLARPWETGRPVRVVRLTLMVH
jgi:predicted secreted protein